MEDVHGRADPEQRGDRQRRTAVLCDGQRDDLPGCGGGSAPAPGAEVERTRISRFDTTTERIWVRLAPSRHPSWAPWSPWPSGSRVQPSWRPFSTALSPSRRPHRRTRTTLGSSTGRSRPAVPQSSH